MEKIERLDMGFGLRGGCEHKHNVFCQRPKMVTSAKLIKSALLMWVHVLFPVKGKVRPFPFPGPSIIINHI